MNWTLMAVLAFLAGPALIAYARHKGGEPVVDADKMPEMAMWGYFLMLVGAWGMLGNWFNMSDLFFALMMVPGVLAGIAAMKGYRAKASPRPLPDWAAFGLSNWLVLGLIGLGKTFLIEPMQIPSSSMRPGLIVGDFIVINKLAYGVRIPFLNEAIIPVGQPQRGDVAVFRFPPDPRLNYIKRIIGTPGDTVEYRNKRLTVNGVPYASEPLTEYVYTDVPNQPYRAIRMRESMGTRQYETLDNPKAPTYDPAAVRPFPYAEACRYDDMGFVCTIPAGHYLALGDNRDNSNDGRYWGFVPDNHLAGRAFAIWMNFGGFDRIGNAIR